MQKHQLSGLISKLVDIIFFGKSVNTFLLVFINAPYQMRCRPRVQSSILFVEKDIEISGQKGTS